MEPDGKVQGQKDKDRNETNPSEWLLKDQKAIHAGSASCHEPRVGVKRGAGCLRDSDELPFDGSISSRPHRHVQSIRTSLPAAETPAL
jgi:hypothetical protein